MSVEEAIDPAAPARKKPAARGRPARTRRPVNGETPPVAEQAAEMPANGDEGAASATPGESSELEPVIAGSEAHPLPPAPPEGKGRRRAVSRAVADPPASAEVAPEAAPQPDLAGGPAEPAIRPPLVPDGAGTLGLAAVTAALFPVAEPAPVTAPPSSDGSSDPGPSSGLPPRLEVPDWPDRVDRRGERPSRRDRGGRQEGPDRSGPNGSERPFADQRSRSARQGPTQGKGFPQGNQPRPRSGGERPAHSQGQGQGQGYGQAQGRNGNAPQITVVDLEAKSLEELHEIARSFELQGYTRVPRTDLQLKILRAQTEKEGSVFGDGILEIIEDGFGFLRGSRFLPSPDDIYVSQSQIRRFGLRTGDRVSGQVRAPKDNEKFFSLLRVEVVNGVDPDTARRRPGFDGLTPIFPLELIDLETQPQILSTRLLNLVAPIGRGQRGLIVSPPKAGKTMLLKSIANGISENNPDMHLMVCLIGERPEEVTDMRRSIDGEVISSTFDEPVEDHTKVAEMALERAKRLVEGGRDVTILLDSITRLARAYNLAVPSSGRTLSGGIDPVALYPPKRFFGAARNIEGGGSLTIVSTCLIDTGSRMDDVIYEEFKGTGNMEIHLDRKLAERRIYPSIDVQRSGTRREELLLDENALRQVWTMRRMVSMLGGSEGTELLLGRLAKTQTNEEFLETLNRDV